MLMSLQPQPQLIKPHSQPTEDEEREAEALPEGREAGEGEEQAKTEVVTDIARPEGQGNYLTYSIPNEAVDTVLHPPCPSSTDANMLPPSLFFFLIACTYTTCAT